LNENPAAHAYFDGPWHRDCAKLSSNRPEAARPRKDEMRNAKILRRVFLFVFVLVAPGLAQNWVGAVPAATGPNYDMSVGYTSLRMPILSAGHVNLNGVDLGARINLSPRWGAVVDSTYACAAQVLGSRYDASILSSYIGPVFYPVERGKTRTFIRALGGVSRVGGAVPDINGGYVHGWAARFSYGFGGGVECHLPGPFWVIINGDYLRTAFYDNTDVARPQNNLRVTGGFVLHLRDRLL
jgi:hypothetical protein